MARKKSDTTKADDKKAQQAGRLIRVREAFLATIDREAKSAVTTPTELVNQLVREGLERRGLWPVKDD